MSEEESPLRFLHSSTEPVERTRNHVPHWQRDGMLYFVTFRLADSLPMEVMEKLLADMMASLPNRLCLWLRFGSSRDIRGR